MPGDPTWYVPVCDSVLKKIAVWLKFYERGNEAASRKYMTQNGRIVDYTTKYAHRMKFTTLEVDHLIRLLDALAEHKELAEDFKTVRRGMKVGRLHIGNEYEVELSFFKADVEEIFDVLVRAKTGRKTIAERIEEQKDTGKGTFEL